MLVRQPRAASTLATVALVLTFVLAGGPAPTARAVLLLPGQTLVGNTFSNPFGPIPITDNPIFGMLGAGDPVTSLSQAGGPTTSVTREPLPNSTTFGFSYLLPAVAWNLGIFDTLVLTGFGANLELDISIGYPSFGGPVDFLPPNPTTASRSADGTTIELGGFRRPNDSTGPLAFHDFAFRVVTQAPALALGRLDVIRNGATSGSFSILVPTDTMAVPEPATWMGGVLAVVVVGATARRRASR